MACPQTYLYPQILLPQTRGGTQDLCMALRGPVTGANVPKFRTQLGHFLCSVILAKPLCLPMLLIYKTRILLVLPS